MFLGNVSVSTEKPCSERCFEIKAFRLMECIVPCFLQCCQLPNQEWCHALIPGLSGGPPGGRPIPGEGLWGGAKHPSQWRHDSAACRRPDGPQHRHRVAGILETQRSVVHVRIFTSHTERDLEFTTWKKFVVHQRSLVQITSDNYSSHLERELLSEIWSWHQRSVIHTPNWSSHHIKGH